MIYTLLEPTHPLLLTKLPELTEEIDRKELVENMVETMKHYGGIGLSANQVGFAYRMFVFGDSKAYVPCFNPKILEESNVMVAIEEGCLTYPGLFVKIHRPDRISVEFEDETGEKHTDELEGLLCRVFQHEMDHMEGTDFTKRAGKLALDMAKRKVIRANRKLKKMNGYEKKT